MTQIANGPDDQALSPSSPGLLERPVGHLSPAWRRVVLYLAAAVLVGVVAGALWQGFTGLPGYTVADNGSASMTERDLTGFFSADFWFTMIGLVAGIGLGVWGWWWFAARGWVLVPLTVLAAVVAALLCWWVGETLGPSNFDERLSQAAPGQVVSIDMDLRSHSALAAWPLGAVLPVMIASAFFSEPGERPRRIRSRAVPVADAHPTPAMPGGPVVSGPSRVLEQLDEPDRDRGEQ